MISTMRRASAGRITAVIPYYGTKEIVFLCQFFAYSILRYPKLLVFLGYARQDRRMLSRVPIAAADVACLLEAMGVDKVITVQLHCGQIQGFFGLRVPVENLYGGAIGVSYFSDMDLVNPVIVAPRTSGLDNAKIFREVI